MLQRYYLHKTKLSMRKGGKEDNFSFLLMVKDGNDIAFFQYSKIGIRIYYTKYIILS